MPFFFRTDSSVPYGLINLMFTVSLKLKGHLLRIHEIPEYNFVSNISDYIEVGDCLQAV